MVNYCTLLRTILWASRYTEALCSLSLYETMARPQFSAYIIPGDPEKNYSRLTKHQTIAFCSITYMYFDSGTQSVKSNKNSPRYTNFLIEFRFQERQIFTILG